MPVPGSVPRRRPIRRRPHAVVGRGDVELEGIEPSSAERSSFALRPFPCLWFSATTSPGRATKPEGYADAAGAFSGVSGLPRRQRSFPPSSPASGARLRWIGPACHRWSLVCLRHLIRSDCEGELMLFGICVGAPFYESEQLGSHFLLPVPTSKPIS